jgi:hypothetical protein
MTRVATRGNRRAETPSVSGGIETLCAEFDRSDIGKIAEMLREAAASG